MIKIDLTVLPGAGLRWVRLRSIEGLLPREALVARCRFRGQHPNMEEDYVLAYVSEDGKACSPVLGAALPT